jgi:hypothetical protein
VVVKISPYYKMGEDRNNIFSLIFFPIKVISNNSTSLKMVTLPKAVSFNEDNDQACDLILK